MERVLREGVERVGALIQQLRILCATANRFQRMRALIFGLFSLNVVLTVSVVAFASGVGGGFAVDAWFERGFPSNMLVVRSRERRALTDLTIVLDGRYSREVEALEPGLGGFEVERDFVDSAGERPGSSYRPRTLELRTARRAMHLSLSEHGR